MPNDISELLAAGVKPPQVEDLGTAFAKAQERQYTLGNLAQQQQLNTQKLAEGKLTLADAQKTFDDNKAIDDAMATNTAPGPDGNPKLNRDGVINALTTSGRGIAASRVQAQFDAQDKAKADAIKLQNEAQVSNLNLVSARAGELGKLAQSVQDAPPEGKQAAYDNMQREALRLGLITPQMQSQFPAQYDPSQDPHINSLILGAQDAKTRSDLQTAQLTRDKDQADLEKTKAATAETWRVSVASQASNALNQQDLDGIRARLAATGAPPAALAGIPAVWTPDAMKQLGRSAMTAEQRTQADQAAATLAETKSRDLANQLNEAALRNQGQQRINQEDQANNIRRVAADPFGALGLNKTPAAGGNPGGPALTGTPFLGTLPPAMATRVQHIASGAETLTAREKGSPAGQALITAVEQYDPSWSEQRAQIRKAFATGTDGRNIGNLNTAPVHLAGLADAATALQNGSFVPGNQLFNSISTMLGHTAPTNFNGMKIVVAGEMAAAMKGNATDPEIASFNKSVNDTNSPAQLAGVIGNVFIPALAAKLQTFNERYHAQSSADDPWTPVLPSARAAFSRYGVDPTASAPATPQAGKAGGPAPQFKKGDTVMYQGKPHKVSDVVNGKLVLEP
jgi:hypothetical protein